MTVETLFGQEEVATKTRSIRFKQIRAVYETLTIKEGITNYLPRCTRFTSPTQIFETFSFFEEGDKGVFLHVTS